ncbi:MAG: N-acetylmuramic acid 6-phosphate etherase [Elusimicrobia bacterium]|nr:N-acetylmuramic acid 6-phosphate etherase [Elusimicrobiota bacterium]
MNPKRFARLTTEKPNPASRGLDQRPLPGLVDLMVRENARAVAAVAREKNALVRGVRSLSLALSRGGRIFFVGAGTSGRLGVLEAAECPPTFNTPSGTVRALMAGGRRAVFRSQEGAEDRTREPRSALRGLLPRDAVVGVAASGVTPYVLSALRTARQRGAATVLVTCNRPSNRALADVIIAARTGPEPLTGSTRLKAGTATKIILNTLTTLAMVQTGKVYDHWMVDLQPRSEKLRARAARLVSGLGGVSPAAATRLLRLADGRAKTAIVMARRGVDRRTAEIRLRAAKGFLRGALKSR